MTTASSRPCTVTCWGFAPDLGHELAKASLRVLPEPVAGARTGCAPFAVLWHIPGTPNLNPTHCWLTSG
jgi:hypothetical protein